VELTWVSEPPKVSVPLSVSVTASPLPPRVRVPTVLELLVLVVGCAASLKEVGDAARVSEVGGPPMATAVVAPTRPPPALVMVMVAPESEAVSVAEHECADAAGHVALDAGGGD